MTTRVFFLNTLRPTTDPAEYEDWIRTGDYPPARAHPSIVSYDVTRIEATLDGTGTPSVRYLEVLEVTDLDTYRQALATPEFEKLLAEWSTYVASAEAIHGTVIE